MESQAHSMGWKLRPDILEIKTKRGVVKLKPGHIFVEATGEKDPVLNLPWKYKYKQCYIVTKEDHARDPEQWDGFPVGTLIPRVEFVREDNVISVVTK